VSVAEGDSVVPGQLLCNVEAMKMENEIHADRGGVITQLAVAAGQAITAGQTICVIDAGG
jgi:acetyl-CoA/propionyl-CoA carboxylase biotin carboxyl carrier protein